MKKSLLSILLVVFLAVISGCADTGSGGGTGNSNTPSYNTDNIPEDKTTIELTKSSNSGGMERTESKAVTITNPRTEAGEYCKASGSKLVFGESGRDMYDLNGETALKENGQSTYYVSITQWNGAMPSEGKLVIAFLTKEEAAQYIPNNDNIVLMPDSSTMTYNPKFLDNTIVDDLNKLGALRQYKFTVK